METESKKESSKGYSKGYKYFKRRERRSEIGSAGCHRGRVYQTAM